MRLPVKRLAECRSTLPPNVTQFQGSLEQPRCPMFSTYNLRSLRSPERKGCPLTSIRHIRERRTSWIARAESGMRSILRTAISAGSVDARSGNIRTA